MLPVVGAAGRGAAHFDVDSRFLADDALLTPSGKVATYWALRDCGVGPGDWVAVPAYHCPTMVYPVIALKAEPVFIAVGDRLEISPAAVAEAIRRGARALILPHFFGFVQPHIDEILRVCRAGKMSLVEDCAHAMYARRGSRLPGSWGDYAITSTRKYIPGSEGGALVANRHPIVHPRAGASVKEEIRGVWHLLNDAIRFGSVPGLAWLGGRGDAPLIGPASDAESQREASLTPASAAETDSSASERLALRSVQWLVRHSDHNRIAQVRRRRFEQWADAVSGSEHVEAFATSLTAEQVPYVFPVRLKRPSAQFKALKYKGISVWRWDHLALSDCQVSARLAVDLVQMPCQHSMGDAAFERLVREFSRAVASA